MKSFSDTIFVMLNACRADGAGPVHTLRDMKREEHGGIAVTIYAGLEDWKRGRR